MSNDLKIELSAELKCKSSPTRNPNLYDFSFRNRELLKTYEDNIYNKGIAFDESKNIFERIEACKHSISAFYELQDFCSRSPEGKIYFKKMWEHCHNSRNPDFSFVEHLEKQKHYLEQLSTLEKDLYEVLEVEPMILQSELIKFYNPIFKEKIRQILKEWESYGAIKRTKYKNSYMIELLP